jgi:hypothetical protein
MRRKSDPGKPALAARVRRETTLPLKAIAALAHLGTSKSANARLHEWMHGNPERKPQKSEMLKKNEPFYGLTPLPLLWPDHIAGVGTGRMPELIGMMPVGLNHRSRAAHFHGR